MHEIWFGTATFTYGTTWSVHCDECGPSFETHGLSEDEAHELASSHAAEFGGVVTG